MFANSHFSFSYLADETEIEAAAKELGEIVGYEREAKIAYDKNEQKHPDQIFLGLAPGSIVNVPDKKVYQPTHPVHQAFYKGSDPLADHLR